MWSIISINKYHLYYQHLMINAMLLLQCHCPKATFMHWGAFWYQISIFKPGINKHFVFISLLITCMYIQTKFGYIMTNISNLQLICNWNYWNVTNQTSALSFYTWAGQKVKMPPLLAKNNYLQIQEMLPDFRCPIYLLTSILKFHEVVATD